MARTQFTFTFADAQPGAAVTFSAAIYADATTTAADGPRLLLDASNAVSVWSDAEVLTAHTVDGNGLAISATATRSNASVSTDDGTAPADPFGSGGSFAVGQLCWFEKSGAISGSGSHAVTWQAISDGVAAFTDAEVGDPDTTQIVVANGGAWHFDIAAVIRNDDALSAVPALTVALNDDSVGPLYDLRAETTLAAGDTNQQAGTLGLGFDIDLADGDVLVFTLGNFQTATSTGPVTLTARRLGDVA